MASALCATISEIVIQCVELINLKNIDQLIKFWRRYVDDIYVVSEHHHLPVILNLINSECSLIQFAISY